MNSSRSLTVNLEDIGITSSIATDLWTGSSLGILRNTCVVFAPLVSHSYSLPFYYYVLRYTASIPAHGSLVLKLSSTTPSAAPTFTFYSASSPSTSLSGGASIRIVNSTLSVAGNVGNGGSVTFTGIDGGSGGGSKLVSIDYINADFTMTNTACSNCRNAIVSVNGGQGQTVQMPLSGQVRLFHSKYSHISDLMILHRAGISYIQDTSSHYPVSSRAKITRSPSLILVLGLRISIALGLRTDRMSKLIHCPASN